MKLLNKLMSDVSDIETYKEQFVENDLQNILFVDPVLSSHDYYTMILPSLALNTFEVANVAYTNINKFISDSEKSTVNLSISEISWADVIVFPFQITKYIDKNGESLFDVMKEFKPDLKIIFIVEVNFWNLFFTSKTGKHPGKQTEFMKFITDNVLFNIKHADRVLVHNSNLENDLKKLLKDRKINTEVNTIKCINNYDTIIEGLNHKKNYPFRDPNQIKIYVDLLDESDIDSFIKNIVDKSSEKCLFFIQTKVHHPKIINFKPFTITHWYKQLYVNNFDYQVIFGTTNTYSKSQFLAGKIIDAGFFACHTIVNSKSLFDYLPKSIQEITSFQNTKKVLQTFDEKTEEDFKKRIKVGSDAREKTVELFEIKNETTSNSLEKLIEVFTF